MNAEIDINYVAASRREVKRKKELISTTHFIINDGGEGVILRKPQSEYYHGRSFQLLKFKVFTSF